jgi:hypothetical protein
MEFVALHYALSHRQDTPYWKANFNKEWVPDLLTLTSKTYPGFLQAIHDRGLHFRSADHLTSGVHCIAAGMHWAPTDLPSLIKGNAITDDMNEWKKNWQKVTMTLNQRAKDWKRAVKNVTSMYDFLKENYYEL